MLAKQLKRREREANLSSRNAAMPNGELDSPTSTHNGLMSPPTFENGNQNKQMSGISPVALDLDRASSSSTLSNSTATGSSLLGAMRKAVRRYQNCQKCGDSTEKTQHCVHCGLILCDRDRNMHIKELIESLKDLKTSSNRVVKNANDKKDKVTQTIIDTEQSRRVARQRVMDEFQQLTDILNTRKKEVLEKLDSFGKDELFLLNEDKILLDQYVKDLRLIEADFHPRLANYTGMSDATLAKLCQTKIAYQDCVTWIQSVVEKDDSFIPIIFEGNQDVKEACTSYGSIGYGKPKRFLERRKSYTSLRLTDEEMENIQNRTNSQVSLANGHSIDLGAQPTSSESSPTRLNRAHSFSTAALIQSKHRSSSAHKSSDNIRREPIWNSTRNLTGNAGS